MEYFAHAPGLSAAAAQWLIDRDVKMVGVDTATVDHPLATSLAQRHRVFPPIVVELPRRYRKRTGREVAEDYPQWNPAGRLLARAGVPVIENVGRDVDVVNGMRCTFHAMPWNWAQGDACIVRLVAILDPSGEYRLERGLAEVRRLGGTAETLVARPDSLDATEAMIAATVAAYGRCDSVFVGSGYNKPAPIEVMPLEDWQAVMDANVRGPWLLAKSFGNHVAARDGGGPMVLVSSVRGRHGSPAGYTAYCTSKGATDALTKTLATEWGPRGINVNAIAPAVFRSTLTDWIFADTEAGRASRERNYARIPKKRLGEPEDFVGIAIYLLSPASDFVTGQIVYADGGYTAS